MHTDQVSGLGPTACLLAWCLYPDAYALPICTENGKKKLTELKNLQHSRKQENKATRGNEIEKKPRKNEKAADDGPLQHTGLQTKMQ